MVEMAAIELLSTHGLTRQYGGLVAVDAVNFNLNQGRIHAIIGPNGAGKTTLVSLICGRTAPSSGRVLFKGKTLQVCLRQNEFNPELFIHFSNQCF